MREHPVLPRLATAALLALLVACGQQADPPVVVAGVTPIPLALQVAAGDEVPLAAVVLPDPGASQAVTWTSPTPAVATVSGAGTAWTLRARARGTTQLTVASVQDPARHAAVALEVFAPPTLSFPAGTALLQAPGALGATVALVNGGDRAAAGVALRVSYVAGDPGWLTVTPAGGPAFDVAAGGEAAIELGAAGDLPSGLYAAVVEPEPAYGVIFSGNPLAVLLRVP